MTEPEHAPPQEPDDAEIPGSGRIAGIDFGTKRVGVALSDSRQSIASPLEIYQRRSSRLDAEYFRELVETERIVGFVVGLPVHMSGDESAKSKQAREFGAFLNRETGVPVAWIDERYSTAAARELLSQSSLSGTKRKAMLDKIAAQVILSTWLESGRSSSGRNLQQPTSLSDDTEPGTAVDSGDD